MTVLGGTNPGQFVVVCCCCCCCCCLVANSWLVCTGVLKAVLKPVLKLAWRCWVGRTQGTFLSCCCFANSWLVCKGVLKPVLKPVLKLAWR